MIDLARVLITGANGMLGSYVDFGLRTDASDLNVLDEAAVMHSIETHRPPAIIHLVGATDTVRCETDPTYAFDLNVRGTQNVARAARHVDAAMVYVSTSRVFRGDKAEPYTETDMPNPDTRYGLTKYMGELVTASQVTKHLIVRTAWVFGGGPAKDTKFHGTVLKQLKAGVEVVALNDVHGSPTYAKDLIATIKDLLLKGEQGIVHAVNSGAATRYDIASHMAEAVHSHSTVRAVDRSHFSWGASLPTNEAVVSKRVALRPWQEALTEYVTEEWSG